MCNYNNIEIQPCYTIEPICWDFSHTRLIFYFFFYFKAETDEYVVEMQNRVQSVAHAEAELQQMNSLLQDLESSMNNTRLRQEEVRSTLTSTWVSGFKSLSFHLFQRRSI